MWKEIGPRGSFCQACSIVAESQVVPSGELLPLSRKVRDAACGWDLRPQQTTPHPALGRQVGRGLRGQRTGLLVMSFTWRPEQMSPQLAGVRTCGKGVRWPSYRREARDTGGGGWVRREVGSAEIRVELPLPGGASSYPHFVQSQRMALNGFPVVSK